MSLKTKTNANSVKNLISHIKVMYYNNDPLIASVEDVDTLYNALCELDEIVGMYEVKDSIVKQIKFLLVNTNSDKHKFENHMLHTVIFGPPGVGKTTIGSCLANVWKGLGLIENKKLFDGFDKSGKLLNQIQGMKNIRILPIFLMKNKHKDQMSTEFNIRSYLEEPDANSEENVVDSEVDLTIDSYIDARNEARANAHMKVSVASAAKQINSESESSTNSEKLEKNINKKKPEELHYKIKELNEEIETLVFREKDSLDDKRRYIKELSEYKRKIREVKLLSVGIKNIVRHSGGTDFLITPKTPLRRTKCSAPIKIVSRPDFVGQYVGHTCDKTQKLLMSTLEEGKVLFIDESYSLITDEKDSFGNEALSELNRFMSEHPELVVIFAGYKDKMDATLFKYQPGLKRRCTWMFEITDYTGEMLADIFKKQLAKENWEFEGKIDDLSKFFNLKIKNFDAFGGDTIRMAFYCKLKYSELKFDYNTRDKLKDRTITLNILKAAYEEMYCLNKPEQDNEREEIWRSMYN